VHEVLNRIIEISSASFARDIRIGFQFDPSLPDIYFDPDHLHEALLNLVKNAAEAIEETDRSGRIDIETRYRAGVTMRSLDPKNTARYGAFEISINDNGPGIPKKAQDNIFKPFFTTKQSGAGIGLSVVAEIVSAHNGFVELDSTQLGTKFKILLPIPKNSN
jgi:two-component system nitrogen regulation sensor histidine kinase GlnL